MILRARSFQNSFHTDTGGKLGLIIPQKQANVNRNAELFRDGSIPLFYTANAANTPTHRLF
jgi:hypothetical protein